jgi:hypothetical protein
MTKLEALARTSKRFTNTIDDSVLPDSGVVQIIMYYEHLLETNEAQIRYMSISNIEKNFALQEAQELLDEADYWDGDESSKW